MKLKKYLWDYLIKNGEHEAPETMVCEDCRGCRYYDFTYKSQLEAKLSWVKSQYRDHLGYIDEIDIISSPKPVHYRNKMDFVATQGIIGQRKGGFNRVYDVHESTIFDRNVDEYLSVLRKFKKYSDYDLVTHEGTIRYFVVRKHNVLDKIEYTLSVVLNNPPKEFGEEFKKFLEGANFWDYFSNIYLVEQSTLTDLSYGNVYERIKGEDLTQSVRVNDTDLVYTFGPQSFFQANVSMFEVILEYMHSAIEGKTFGRIIDAYGGVGSIGIALQQFTNEIVNVEVSEENSSYFDINIQNNCPDKLSTTSITSTVDDYLKLAEFKKEDLLVLDPPRAGMQSKAAKMLTEKAFLPSTIIYMSCNPATQVQDLEILTEKYNINQVKVFDMFPYTSHVEAVAILSLKSNK